MVLPITYKWYFTTIIWTIISLQDKAEKWDFLIKFSKYLLKSPRSSIERINSKSCSPNILHICPKRSLLSCMDQITIVSSSEQAYQFANFYRGDNGDEAYNAMIIRNVASNANNWFLDWKKKRRMDACLDKRKLQRTHAGGVATNHWSVTFPGHVSTLHAPVFQLNPQCHLQSIFQHYTDHKISCLLIEWSHPSDFPWKNFCQQCFDSFLKFRLNFWDLKRILL